MITIKRRICGHTLITPDGKYVAAKRYNSRDDSRQKTAVWDVETGKTVLNLPFSSFWMSMSADGSVLVTRASDRPAPIKFWNVRTGKEISSLTKKKRGKTVRIIPYGEISPDGRILVTSGNKDIFFWDATTGKYITSQNQSKYSSGYVRSFGFSGDGKRLAVGSGTEVVTVWSVEEILKKAKFDY